MQNSLHKKAFSLFVVTVSRFFRDMPILRMGTLRRYPRKIAWRQEIDDDSSLKDCVL